MPLDKPIAAGEGCFQVNSFPALREFYYVVGLAIVEQLVGVELNTLSIGPV